MARPFPGLPAARFPNGSADSGVDVVVQAPLPAGVSWRDSAQWGSEEWRGARWGRR